MADDAHSTPAPAFQGWPLNPTPQLLSAVQALHDRMAQDDEADARLIAALDAHAVTAAEAGAAQ